MRFANRRREEKRVGADLEIAMNGARRVRRRRQHAEEREDEQELHDHDRRIAMNVAQRAAEADAVGCDGAEREEKKEREENIEERLFEVIAQLEFEDFEGHAASASRLAMSSVEK